MAVKTVEAILYSLRLMLTSVTAEVELGLEVRKYQRCLVLSATSCPPPRLKREVTTREYERMGALQSTIQGYLDNNFPGTEATALDFVLTYARLIRRCEFRGGRVHESILLC